MERYYGHIMERVQLPQEQPQLTPTYTAAAGDAGNTVTLTMTVTS